MADSKGSSGKGSAPKPGSGNIGNIGPKMPPDDCFPIAPERLPARPRHPTVAAADAPEHPW